MIGTVVCHGKSLRKLIHTEHREILSAIDRYCICAVDNNGYTDSGALSFDICIKSLLNL